MHTLLRDKQLDTQSHLTLSVSYSSPAVVMAAVGTPERDFTGVIPKAEHCEMWSRSESSKWEERENGPKNNNKTKNT